MWHDVPNRGGDVTSPPICAPPGISQLLSGWQGDNAGATAVPGERRLPPALLAPCAAPYRNDYVKTPVLDGVTGQILGRIINRSGPDAAPLNVMGNPIPYFPADANDNAGRREDDLTKETINGKVTAGGTVPNSDWKFCGGGTFAAPLPVTALPVSVCLKGGFDPAKLYQLVYTVKDPYVLGAGTAAFRDVQSFFRYAADDDFGTPNPLAGKRPQGHHPRARRSRAISRATSSTSA